MDGAVLGGADLAAGDTDDDQDARAGSNGDAIDPTERARRVRAGQLTLARILLAGAVVVWIASLNTLRHAPVNEYGLLHSGVVGLILPSIALTVGFGLAIRANAPRDCVAFIAAFVAVTRATASIIVDLPIYTWTYKHIGVADHLSTTGHLARNVDIYNNWPGFFSAAAWFSDITGVSFEEVARWFPVVADVAIVLGMYAISRAFGHTQQIAFVAAFGIQALNWVAQDYYSPQATAFILALLCLALLVRSRTHPRAAWLAVLPFIAITVTHQLTPFWITGTAFLLGITKRIRPRWIFLIYAAITLVFALLNLKAIAPYGLLTGFDPLANAQSNIPTLGNAGRSFTSLATKSTTGLMWLSAFVCAAYAWRKKQPVWVPAVLAFTSFGLLAGNSYGGEAIFRVLLYSLPGNMLLLAPVVTRAILGGFEFTSRLRAAASAVRRLVIAGIAVFLVVGSLQCYYGTWFINVVDEDGLVAQSKLLETAPTDSLLIPLTLGIAERPVGRYVDFLEQNPDYDHALILLPGVLSSRFTPAEVQKLTTGLRETGKPVYLIITEQMRRYSDYYGFFPAGAITRLVGELASSSQWTTLANTPTLSMFRLNR